MAKLNDIYISKVKANFNRPHNGPNYPLQLLRILKLLSPSIVQFTSINAKSIHLTPKPLYYDDIVKESGSSVTEKQNDRVKVFHQTQLKETHVLKSNYKVNFGSSVERSCGSIDGAEICHLSEKSVYLMERELALSLLT